MILLLDTSTPHCYLTLLKDSTKTNYEWHADRELADGLLTFLEEKLQLYNETLGSLQGIGFMKGPGSFTGLRIGVSVLNTIASDRQIPIVGVTGEDWRDKALERLGRGENDQVVMPEYGQPANITKPRK